MITELWKEIRSTPREIRGFALVMGIACLLVGGWMAWKTKPYPWIVLAAAFAFILVGYAAPWALRPLHKAWMVLAAGLGFVISRILLTILFFAVVTPIGLIGRLFGKRFADIRFADPSQKTYWRSRTPEEREEGPSRFENQF